MTTPIRSSVPGPDGIHWPARFHPSRAPVHVSNALDIPAPLDAAWAWLVRAPLWPTWYPNSRNVRIAGGAGTLSLGSRFTWRTFGMAIRSEVVEFLPRERIAWNAWGVGVDAYHAWLIRPTRSGCTVLTEETQYGVTARLNRLFFPSRMHRFHQVWLEELSRVARAGVPPSSADPTEAG